MMFVWHICLFLLLAFPRTQLANIQAKHQRLERASNLQKHEEMLATAAKAILWIILVFSPCPKEEPPAGCIIKSLILKLFLS